MAEPCQVDFYVLGDESRSPHALICRLALMAWEKGLRVTLLAQDQRHAGQLDELLWEQPAGRFIPHELDSSGQRAPVTITTPGHPASQHGDVLINLTQAPVAQPDHFQRVLEVVPASADDRQASREKFTRYRNLGLQPAHHPVGRH